MAIKKLRRLTARPDTQSEPERHNPDGDSANSAEQENQQLIALIKPDPNFAIEEHGLRVRRQVTIPTLQFPVGSSIVCRINSAIRESSISDGRMGTAKIMEIQGVNGSLRLLIVGSVLHSALTSGYKGDSYVGKWFLISKVAARPDKRYAQYGLAEIDTPDGAVSNH